MEIEMVTAIKRRVVKEAVNGSQHARRRGGEYDAVSVKESAAPRTKLGESIRDTERCAAEQAAGETTVVTESAHVSSNIKGRSTGRLKPNRYENGQAGGERGVVSEDQPAARKTKRSRGEMFGVSDMGTAPAAEQTATGERGYATDFSAACRELQSLQRRRVSVMKFRIAIGNQLRATVATSLGYFGGMEEKDREAAWTKAAEVIEQIDAGDDTICDSDRSCVSSIILITQSTREGLDAEDKLLCKAIEKQAAQLPVAKWVEGVRGFGLKSLGTIIGETGDLSLYANPAKVWKRLGLAPFNGKMPSTWRSGKEGKLSSEEWSAIGYSPRRRSVMYVIGESLVKQNDGDYRKRYDEAKAAIAAAHPDYSKGRCHNHGMLLCVKRLVRDLWKQWRAA
jgi:hypothetical protein